MQRDAYVFLQFKGEEMPVARIQHRRERGGDRFYFRYGKRYLEQPGAFSIDPRQLPLSETVSVHDALPLAIQDNGPDEFGRYLYEVLHGAPPESPLDYHLDNGLAGIGALALSSTLEPPADGLLLRIDSFEEIVEAFEDLEASRPLSHRMSLLLEQGRSLPGARPKARYVDDDGVEWIAKFERREDVFNIPIAEHATMCQAKSIMRVADTQVIPCGRHNVFLTKRFDRSAVDQRHHFLSAYTLMGANKVNPDLYYRDFGYAALGQLVKQISSSPGEERKELYRRLLFNVMVGNRDDHLKNHGFLKDLKGPLYNLSPAYDVVPGAGSPLHAIGVGVKGAGATLENVLSQSELFGYNQAEAKDILLQIDNLVPEIIATAAECGMTEKERNLLEQRMMRFDGNKLYLGSSKIELSTEKLEFDQVDMSDIRLASGDIQSRIKGSSNSR